MGVWQARWQGATTQQADACKEEQRRQRVCQTLNRVSSARTQSVSNFKAKKLNAHGGFLLKISGQLPFSGLSAQREAGAPGGASRCVYAE